MEDLEIGSTKKIRCRLCKHHTNHILLYKLDLSEEAVEIEDWLLVFNRVYQCMGCDTVCLVEMHGLSSDRHPETGEYELQENIYPNPYATRQAVRDFFSVPDKVDRIYQETIKAHNNDLRLLTAIGIGSIIEAICKDKGISSGNAEKKINALVDRGIVTQDGGRLLHIAREHRNFSAHEVKPMSRMQLDLCLDVIDSTLMNLYVLPDEFKTFQAIQERESGESII